MENFITRIGETIVTILLELYAKLPSRVDSRTDVAPIFRAISRGKEKKKEGSFERETLVESFFRRALREKISCGIEMGQGSRSFRSKEFRVESNWDK